MKQKYFILLYLDPLDYHMYTTNANFILFFRIMQACCDVAFNYAHLREQFGQKIGEFQVSFVKMK